ncbi:MAG: type III-A CRISPR-associated RAMP protein Csm3, partial [Actinobacteria bacterium]|nr:type III-A CRISPR-associated RAMP protein Csm3 [Actinomycetota bacterium]
MRRLENIKELRGRLTNITGLRIGGNEGIVKIGGIDSPIIRNPMTGEPYIPGSSLRGKMRSLLELKEGKVEPNGEPHKYKKDGKEPCFNPAGT